MRLLQAYDRGADSAPVAATAVTADIAAVTVPLLK